MTTNRMKRKLLAGEPAFGVSVMIPSPHIVDIVGRLGFDWVLIDCEHGSIGIESVELMVMAAETAGVTPIARPPVNGFEAIGQLMDRGVMGVQVPHVNTAEDARRAVEAVKYHPLGERGLAAGVRSAGYGYGMSMSEYAENANRETLVCVQLEEAEAVPTSTRSCRSPVSTSSSSARQTSLSPSDTPDAQTPQKSAKPWTPSSPPSPRLARFPALQATPKPQNDTSTKVSRIYTRT